ncbi:MAG: DUF4249 family protein [Bacteroidales bacterium]
MLNSLLTIKILSTRQLVILVLLAAGFAACTQEIDIYTDGQPVLIVCSLLDPASEVQYVRIGRSYRGGKDAMNQPPESDSTVWNIPHEVYMEEYTDGQKGNTYRFEPDNNIKKDSGFFPDTNLRVYSSAFKPVPGKFYHLYVYFPDLDKMVSAKTIVHGSPQIVDPLPLSIRKINFEPGQPYTIRWFPGMNSGVYQMIFRIYYRDSSAFGQEFNSADYASKGVYNLQTDQMLEYAMGGPAFFTAMATEIPVITGIVREVISVEFIMISGGSDLGIHYRSGLETGTNFTNLREYSNIGNGIGIFSSRSENRVPNLSLSGVTLDELARGEKTRSLGFKGQ